MVERGAYGERMAGYLHLSQPLLYAKLGSGHSELSVTRLHAPKGFSEPTTSIPIEKAFSIHLHLLCALEITSDKAHPDTVHTQTGSTEEWSHRQAGNPA